MKQTKTKMTYIEACEKARIASSKAYQSVLRAETDLENICIIASEAARTAYAETLIRLYKAK